jgi:hypothetical protein
MTDYFEDYWSLNFCTHFNLVFLCLLMSGTGLWNFRGGISQKRSVLFYIVMLFTTSNVNLGHLVRLHLPNLFFIELPFSCSILYSLEICD